MEVQSRSLNRDALYREFHGSRVSDDRPVQKLAGRGSRDPHDKNDQARVAQQNRRHGQFKEDSIMKHKIARIILIESCVCIKVMSCIIFADRTASKRNLKHDIDANGAHDDNRRIHVDDQFPFANFR